MRSNVALLSARDQARRLQIALSRWLTPERARVYPASVVVLVLGGWLVSQLAGPGLADASGTILGADFSALWIGGHLVSEGQLASLYDPELQRAALDALLAPEPNDAICPFVNPPWAALALAPLGALPYLAALALWWAACALAWVASAHLLRSALAPLRERTLPRTLWLSLAFFPTLACFTYGQSSTLSLLAWTAMALDLRRDREVRAGLFVGLLAWKPQLCLGPLVFLLFSRRWRALGGFALSAGAWVALGLALAPEAVLSWVGDAPALFELIRSDGYRSFGLISSFGFGALLLDPLGPRAGALAGGLLTVLTSLAIAALGMRSFDALRDAERGGAAQDMTLAAALALSVLASPHLYVYDATLLLLALALVLARHPGSREQLMDGGPILAATGLLWVALFVGPYLTLAVQDLLSHFELPPIAIQTPALAIAWWAYVVQRSRASDISRE